MENRVSLKYIVRDVLELGFDTLIRPAIQRTKLNSIYRSPLLAGNTVHKKKRQKIILSLLWPFTARKAITAATE